MEQDTRFTNMKSNTKYMVVLREYERGWGSNDFVAHEYEDRDSAVAYVSSVNAENNLPTVPDYYITARLIEDPAEFKHYERLL